MQLPLCPPPPRQSLRHSARIRAQHVLSIMCTWLSHLDFLPDRRGNFLLVLHVHYSQCYRVPSEFGASRTLRERHAVGPR